MTRRPLPIRTLAERPDLDQLKRQGKELLDAFRAHQPGAVAEVTAHYHHTDSKVRFIAADRQHCWPPPEAPRDSCRLAEGVTRC